ncbi:AtpZ/AtpI family protein [Draconibacterium halophilum]|uniref:AtpZ/AtpI family protein n=1 Tax=Draconibacterium halophilum TaxID=2706887 RepID=A0A6C0R9R7_9BACT|nr:AtpZ/AtpI family protein [Draconibacterium halophilum]QIA06692.1 AtpZ/AtpI family protein [Draconibacterium halophilum]
MKKKKPYTTQKTNSFIRYSSLGFEMMAIIGVFTFLGYKIDQWMHNEFKGFTLALVIFGVVVSIVYGTKSLLRTDHKSKKPKRK